MNESLFWRLIEQAHPRREARTLGELAEHRDNLINALLELEPDEIAAFHALFTDKLREAYRADLWDAAYIIQGGCGDDGFYAFRCWLIGEGEGVYRAVLHDPTNLVRYAGAGGTSREELGAAASRAYCTKTGVTQIPYEGSRGPEPLKGELCDESRLRERYAEIWDAFWDRPRRTASGAREMDQLRTCVVVGVPMDAPIIGRFHWKRLGLKPVLCVSESEIEALPTIDSLVAVLTPTSLCSTMFQGAVLRALAISPRDVPCWVANLSGEDIPLGLAALRNCEPAPADLVG